MLKRIFGLMVAAVMILGIFGLTACDNVSLADYKATKSQALQDYANAKGKSNYCETGWEAVCKAVTDGKAAIETATTKPAVTTAFNDAKGMIDAVEREDEVNDFNATIYDNINSWVNEEFLKKNLTYEEDDVNKEKPYAKVFIIKNISEYNELFIDFPAEIDFENNSLFLYVFSCYYIDRSYEISEITIDGQTLIIEFDSISPGEGIKDASSPNQRCFAVIMNKINITETAFKADGDFWI